jgi:hypothetical protein
MSATQDLIAAALTAADLMEGMIGESYRPVGQMLRELCARAMREPNMAEVEWLVHELSHTAYRSGHAAASRAEPRGIDTQRSALLDYVRGVIAERDALIAAHAGATKKMARDERQLFESWIVRECGPGETKRWLNTEVYENMHVNDYRTGWVACLGLMSAAPQPVSAAEVPMPEPDTHCYDDDVGRDVWSHSPEQMRTYGEQCRAAGYAAGLAAGGKDAERYRAALIKLSCLGNGDRPGNSEGNEIAIAALRGEVK